MSIIRRSIVDRLTFLNLNRSSIRAIEILDIITFNQASVQDTLWPEIISSVLALSQHIVINLIPAIVTQNLIIEQTIIVGKVRNVSVGHILSFGNRVAKAISVSVSQSLIFLQFINSPLDIIELEQTIDVFVTKYISNNLILNQITSCKLLRTRLVTNVLMLNSSVDGYIHDPSFIAIPVISSNPHHIITLTFDSTILTLQDPEFGDSDKYEQSRILRRNRGGELNIYRDTIWPTTETLVYTFKYLSQEDGWKLLDFMNRSLGKQVLLNDHEGIDWEGIIISPTKELVQEGRFNFAASFEFEGVRI